MGGLGCLLLPIVSLVYCIMYWEDAKQAFLLHVAGYGLMILPFMFGSLV